MTEPPNSLTTCAACRERWARTHDPATGTYILHTPIAYLKIYAGDDLAQPVALARSFHDLRSAIATMPVGSRFTVEIVAFMLTVGCGLYTRLADGVATLMEEGACKGLAIAMMDARASTHI